MFLLLALAELPPANLDDLQFRPKTHLILPDKLPKPYHTKSVRAAPTVIRTKQDAPLKVPPGFHIKPFAIGLNSPRWLHVLPNGDVLVAESYQGRIRLLRDSNGTGVANEYHRFATGLNLPHGMALQNGHLYIANTNSVVRFPYKAGQTKLVNPQTVVRNIPSRGWRQHWTRNILFTQDGKHFYLTVGSESNKSPEPPPRATIMRYNADGTGARVFASGLRNPVALCFKPGTDELWTTNVERDYMGNDIVPDFVTSVREGDFFGWPWFYIGNKPDPQLAHRNPPKNPNVRVPDVLVNAHSTPLGMVFYEGGMFPQEYSGDAFVAMRGSTNRLPRSGNKIIRIRNRDGKLGPEYEEFITGWVPDATKNGVYGRPVGVAVWTDGSLLVSDEAGHKLWRVTYVGEAQTNTLSRIP
jgi:glucose/arabinose dehydrogenase